MSSQYSFGRVVIAGGSGFIGTSLASYLNQRGYDVVILSRQNSNTSNYRYARWDARSIGDWVRELDGAVGIVNLVGRSVDCIKTPAHQDEILRSRVEATRILGRAMRSVSSPPPTWVQMSTAHIYGDPPEIVCDESTLPGIGLAPTVGIAWEQEFSKAKLPSQREVVLRTSFVVGRHGGAMQRFKLLARFGLAGTIAGGKQGISWIHEDDMNAILERAMFNETMTGIYNVTSPNPVSQKVFMRELRRAIHVPIGLPATAWMVRIGAPLLLKSDPDLALYGRYVIPARLISEGYQFKFSNCAEALKNLL